MKAGRARMGTSSYYGAHSLNSKFNNSYAYKPKPRESYGIGQPVKVPHSTASANYSETNYPYGCAVGRSEKFADK